MSSKGGKRRKNKLNPKQEKAINLLVFCEYSRTETASEVNVHYKTLWEWLNQNELFIKAYEKAEKAKDADVRRMFKSKTYKAVNKIVSLVDCGDPKAALAAAKEVLDRADGRMKTNVSVTADTDGDVEILIMKREEREAQKS